MCLSRCTDFAMVRVFYKQVEHINQMITRKDNCQVSKHFFLYLLNSVPKEEDPFQPKSHPRVGPVCNGAYSSR